MLLKAIFVTTSFLNIILNLFLKKACSKEYVNLQINAIVFKTKRFSIPMVYLDENRYGFRAMCTGIYTSDMQHKSGQGLSRSSLRSSNSQWNCKITYKTLKLKSRLPTPLTRNKHNDRIFRIPAIVVMETRTRHTTRRAHTDDDVSPCTNKYIKCSTKTKEETNLLGI